MRVRSFGVLEMRAYHEAGHVLVALLEGFRVKRVTISRRGRIGGACEYGLLVPRRASRRALRRIVGATAAVALAGSAAQDREALARGLVALDPRSCAMFPLFGAGSEDDARIATRFARRLGRRAGRRRAERLGGGPARGVCAPARAYPDGCRGDADRPARARRSGP